MALDGAGYLLAVSSVAAGQPALVSLLEDIFVAVAILTITVGLVLPGMIAHAVGQVAHAAARLATGTLADLTRAMHALGAGDLDAARASRSCRSSCARATRSARWRRELQPDAERDRPRRRFSSR